MAAKAEVGILTDDLPRRSPDLNVLDYSLWALIGKEMRKQEVDFPKGFKETMDAFKVRLRKTAMGLPTRVVKNCVGDMKWRCRLVAASDGGLIKE